MTTNTPPEVGTFMRWGEVRAEVLLASPEHLVARDGHGWLLALRYLDGEWRDNEGDRWVIVEAMATTPPPPVGTTMRWGELRAEVLLASSGYLVARGEDGWLQALLHVDGTWRGNGGGLWGIEVQP